MIKLYRYARIVHRVLVLVISALTVFMAGTGLLLKYPGFAFEHLSFIDVGQMRYLHNQLSLIFTILLLVMAVTGWLMYLLPVSMRRRQQSRLKPTETS
jgi:uncharacterized iron-regulated membrane protein